VPRRNSSLVIFYPAAESSMRRMVQSADISARWEVVRLPITVIDECKLCNQHGLSDYDTTVLYIVVIVWY
jgi:hypothetical protein